MPDKITSMTNPRIRRLVELRKKAKLRRETGLFIIEGTRLCMDTPERFLEEVYVTEDWLRTAAPADAEKIQRFHPLILAEEVMAKAADTDTPQGILCAARMPVWTRQDLLGGPDGTPAPLLLVLEDVRDPGNLGTIFRTAEAAGATGILMSRGTVDLFNPKVVRATMSAIFRMPFVISDAAYKNAVDEFRVRSKAGTLPEAMKITRYDLRDTEQEEELFNSEQAVIGLFGSENVEIIDEGDK
jgi:TrmH family RNA methyltransferase